MPDALQIVPPVVEEMADEDADRMEIDSSMNSTPGDTLAACVQCLVQCFNPTAASAEGKPSPRGTAPASRRLLSQTIVLGGYVDRMTSPLGQALTYGGRPVARALYEDLSGMLTRVDQASSSDALVGPLTMLASALLTRDPDESVEAIRQARAEASLAYLKLGARRTRVPDALMTELRKWRARERSALVQRILDQALELIP